MKLVDVRTLKVGSSVFIGPNTLSKQRFDFQPKSGKFEVMDQDVADTIVADSEGVTFNLPHGTLVMKPIQKRKK